MPRGLLAVWVDAEPSGEADFNEWYDRQHLIERVGVPGFLDGRRLVAVAGTPRYLALYETETPDVLVSPAYRERLSDPTDWTTRVMPSFRNMHRGILTARLRVGRGQGGAVATLRLQPTDLAALERWLLGGALSRLIEAPGVLSATLAVAELAEPGGSTKEQILRGAPDRRVPAAIIVEGNEARALARSVVTGLPGAEVARHGGGKPARGVYRLLTAVDSRDVPRSA